LSNSNGFSGTKRAVFLDRDGTINIEKDYLYRPEDFEFVPGAAEAVKLLKQHGYLVVVVTNQSGVARGYYTEDDVQNLHSYIDRLLDAAGTAVDAWYYCPHHTAGKGDYAVDCQCRKPLPGMLLKAASDLDIDLSGSWMVGDKLVDVEAGIAAGCKPLLVMTGYGEDQSGLLPDKACCVSDINQAARLIVSGLTS
jgi:D-glycero-D-manno-heptose 1,7-bisphosphate phosphatase